MVALFTTSCTTALLIASICFAAKPKDPPLTMSVGEVMKCPDYRKPAMRMNNPSMRVDHKTGDLFLNGEVVLDEPLDDPMSMSLEFYKCVIKAEHSCTLQSTLERPKICDDLPKKGMVWSYVLEKMEGLETKCPVPAGTYKMVDAPITKAMMETLPLNQGHWRIRTILKKNGRVVACMRGYGEVKPKRRQKG